MLGSVFRTMCYINYCDDYICVHCLQMELMGACVSLPNAIGAPDIEKVCDAITFI